MVLVIESGFLERRNIASCIPLRKIIDPQKKNKVITEATIFSRLFNKVAPLKH